MAATVREAEEALGVFIDMYRAERQARQAPCDTATVQLAIQMRMCLALMVAPKLNLLENSNGRKLRGDEEVPALLMRLIEHAQEMRKMRPRHGLRLHKSADSAALWQQRVVVLRCWATAVQFVDAYIRMTAESTEFKNGMVLQGLFAAGVDNSNVAAVFGTH